jgi:type VI secretion system FHA domain protein
MELSMTVLRCPDQVAPEARTVSGGEFHVGRGPDVDWVLPDPDRLLSKRHFAVAYLGGSWQIADTSTNGTYLNGEGEPIGRGAPRSLRDGDRVRLGAYEIEIRVVEQPAYGDSRGAVAGYGGAPGRSSQTPFGDPFAQDLLAPAPQARRPFDEAAYPDLGLAPGAQLPHDFDPLAPEHGDDPYGGGFRGPVQSDHSSSMEDALIPPPVAGYVTPHTGGAMPGGNVIPDDWDNLLDDIAPPPQTPASPITPSRTPSSQPHAFEDPAPFGSPGRPGQAVPFSAAPSHQPAPGPTTAPFGNSPQGSPLTGPAATQALEASPFGTPPGQPAAMPRSPAPPAKLPEPMDFDDPLAPLEEAPRPPPAQPMPVANAGAPVVRQRTPRQATPPSTSWEADPFHDQPGPGPEMPATMRSAAGAIGDVDPRAGRQAIPTPGEFPPLDEPSDLPGVDLPAPARPASPVAAPTRPAAAPTSSAPAADNGAALAAFFKGAELSGAAPADPLAMMTGLGEAFRALVAGLRQVLIARATIKGEFRIEQTMIRARGNNPLKFSANDDDALTALLGVGRRTDMAPAAAIEDSLRDLRLHELATMAAMQVAVRALLEELSPDKIRAGTDQGGMAVLPAQRKARAWDAFEARHAHVVRALVDDFDSIFGKSFARAYERALDEISLRERQ